MGTNLQTKSAEVANFAGQRLFWIKTRRRLPAADRGQHRGDDDDRKGHAGPRLRNAVEVRPIAAECPLTAHLQTMASEPVAA